MKILLNSGLLILCICFAVWAYITSGKTRAAEHELARLQREIKNEREAISILEAEWAYLNRPDRLRRLVKLNEQKLQLVPISASSYGEVPSIPYEALEAVNSLPKIDEKALEETVIKLERMNTGEGK